MKRILIIEDDPIVSHIYRSRLEKAGFEVDVAADGQTGYFRVLETSPDALLLDLMLPRMNGIDLLKKIRALQQFEKLPIVVFTNAFVATMIHDAFFNGASVVYNKSSVTPRQIIEALNTSFAAGANRSVQSAVPTPEPPPRPRTVIPIVSNEDDDETFESALRKTFLQNAGASVGELRRLLQGVGKAASEAARAEQLEQLCRKTRALAANAGMAKLHAIATVGSANEALLKEMFDKPAIATPSVLRTIASAIDLIEELAQDSGPPDRESSAAIKVLVIDEDAESRQTIASALKASFCEPTAPETLDAGVIAAQETEFDLIILALNGGGGFDLCDCIRRSGASKATPVLFAAASTDFQLKSQCTLRGPSDLISKPVMPMELTVKALIMALRYRAEQSARDAGLSESPPWPAKRQMGMN